jgi:hypothetical protein
MKDERKTHPTADHTAFGFDAARLNARGGFVNDIRLPA